MSQERYIHADIEIWRNEVNAAPTIVNYGNADHRWKIQDLTEGIYEAKFRPDATDLATADTPGYGITVCTFSVPPIINPNTEDADIVKEFDVSIREGKAEVLINLVDKDGDTIPAADVEWVKLGGIFQDTEHDPGGGIVAGQYQFENVPYGTHRIAVKTDNFSLPIDDTMLQPYFSGQTLQISKDGSSEFTVTIHPPMDLRIRLDLSRDIGIPGFDRADENPNVRFYQRASAPDSDGNYFWLNLPTFTADGREYRVQNAGDGSMAIRMEDPTSTNAAFLKLIAGSLRYSNGSYQEISVPIHIEDDHYNLSMRDYGELVFPPELILR